jgi:membrane fusion protein, heavy metal efflux system
VVTSKHSGWLTVVLLMAACGRQPQPAPSNRSRPVAPRVLRVDAALLAEERIKTVVVERRLPMSELKLPGEVRSSLNAAEVGALVSGRLSSILAVEGACVERGQVLAWLDAPEIARATADLLRARARATAAEHKLGRQIELDAKQATSRDAIDEAQAEAAVARADVAAARTLLRSLGGSVPSPDDASAGSFGSRIALRAPVSGVVVRRDAVIGSAVTPERTLFWLNGNASPMVLAYVPEGSQAPVEGARARLQNRGSALECDATVRGQLGVVDPVTRSAALRLEADAGCTELAPGSYLDVTFSRPAGATPGLVVPRAAIVDVHSVSVAFVTSSTPSQFDVRTVRVLDPPGPELLVESGLKEGERVVQQGALLLKGELLKAELSGE